LSQQLLNMSGYQTEAQRQQLAQQPKVVVRGKDFADSLSSAFCNFYLFVLSETTMRNFPHLWGL
jgi:hypothetical protein